MKNRFKYVLYITLYIITVIPIAIGIGIISSCKTPYAPAPITAVNNYLVVEGLININDSTFISLSRTVGVMNASTVKPELKATISIVSNTGGSYPLKEVGNGMYSAPSYNLSAANQYRLMIKTSSGSTYASDFEQTKVTPPIDSLITQFKPDGLYISVNAHDATNNTRYYRWDFDETWQFTSYFDSHLTAQGAATSPAAMSPLYAGPGISVLPRTNDIYHCWGNNTSHLITINTTAGLSQDIIQNQPITFVASSSEKLSIRYSINIRQYALTPDSYAFWTLLQKNTEQLGSIFDSQPSATIGNIHNINNPAEPVIGYMSACTVSQTRIYINYTDLPKSYVADYQNNTPYNQYTCVLQNPNVTVPGVWVYWAKTGEYEEFDYLINAYPYNPIFIPIDVITPFNPLTLAGSVTAAIPACVDCTLRGTNVKPAFWQ